MDRSTEVASWVQTGGLLAFASAVYWEIRQIRPWMKSIGEALAVIRDRELADVRKSPRTGDEG